MGGTPKGVVTVCSETFRRNALNLLNGISIGLRSNERALRQILQCCASSLDGLLHARNFMGWNVVYHHDVAALERRCQALLDIGHQRCSVDWRREPLVPSSCYVAEPLRT